MPDIDKSNAMRFGSPINETYSLKTTRYPSVFDRLSEIICRTGRLLTCFFSTCRLAESWSSSSEETVLSWAKNLCIKPSAVPTMMYLPHVACRHHCERNTNKGVIRPRISFLFPSFPPYNCTCVWRAADGQLFERKSVNSLHYYYYYYYYYFVPVLGERTKKKTPLALGIDRGVDGASNSSSREWRYPQQRMRCSWHAPSLFARILVLCEPMRAHFCLSPGRNTEIMSCTKNATHQTRMHILYEEAQTKKDAECPNGAYI